MHSPSLQTNRVNLGVIIMTSQSGGKSREDVSPVSAASGLLPAKRTRVTWMKHSSCTWVSDLEGPTYLDVKNVLQLRIVLTGGWTTKRLPAKRIMHRACPWTCLNGCWIDAWFHWLSSPSWVLRWCLDLTAPMPLNLSFVCVRRCMFLTVPDLPGSHRNPGKLGHPELLCSQWVPSSFRDGVKPRCLA